MTPVNIDTCRYWQLLSFRSQFWTKNGKSSNFDEILYFAQAKSGEFNSDNNFLWFLTPVKLAIVSIFVPVTFQATVSMKFCILHETRVVNSIVSILRDVRGCPRELKLGIEKQILCQKYYRYIINKTGNKLWLTSVKLFSYCKLCQYSYLLKTLTISELALEHIVKRNHY